jgi:thioredoxin 1
VQKQSTLIVFKGRQEAGRSTGDTNASSIETLLAKAI